MHTLKDRDRTLPHIRRESAFAHPWMICRKLSRKLTLRKRGWPPPLGTWWKRVVGIKKLAAAATWRDGVGRCSRVVAGTPSRFVVALVCQLLSSFGLFGLPGACGTEKRVRLPYGQKLEKNTVCRSLHGQKATKNRWNQESDARSKLCKRRRRTME
jgi:hypothetical protein